ncbi:mono-functional DNA-alkylating methyl methanesulfonate N-term-domain-containing protein [Xylaria digitata]|nr:mono-functional DNA-alkylating methyl methanesulfonate N-term-domain-containing protein [Xylaria digitata]
MASLQTHVFENDGWVTRTVTAAELVGANSRPRVEALAPPKPPTYGILTRTIIESPVLRWVLPVQLRSSNFNDVALVGDQYVQICELSTDAQLQPIAKKVDLGSKIRNCCVMGTHDYLRTNREARLSNYYNSSSDDVNMMDSGPFTSSYPPRDVDLFQQVLVLVLSTGELVFLFMSLTAAGNWEFVSSHSSILSGRLVDPGFHMTISPDGGYLALACSENLFIVYQLESIEDLHKQHNEGLPIKPIRSTQARAVKGVIHKINFLHPSAANESQLILLVITARLGVFRLAIYEWVNSESLQDVLDEEKPGIRLDGTAGIPLLIIPSTVGSQFLIITENSLAICSDILSGSPLFGTFSLEQKDSTDWHHGSHAPMWTAWARPMREESYHADTDMIYLAREDGWVNILEINDCGVESSIYIGPLECNIDSGFASLSTSLAAELLVATGDYGHGAIWSVPPNEPIRLIGSLPHWSTTVDVALTKHTSKHSKSEHKKLSKRRSLAETTPNHMMSPDKIFACSGRGVSGAIVELRYGIQAKIGLDLLYSSRIKRCWVIPNFADLPEEGFSILLALPENSALLHISHDLCEVSEKAQSAVAFDLLSTTLAVHVSKGIIIQITTMYATIVSSTTCYQHLIGDMIEDPLATVADCAITDEILALSVYSHSAFKIMVFGLVEKARFVLKDVFEVKGEITALSVSTLSAGICVLVGLSQKELSTFAIFPINSPQSGVQTMTGTQQVPIELKLGEDGDVDSMAINAVTSIIYLGDDKIVVGMRNGDVLTIHSTGGRQFGQEPTVTRTNHFGVSASHVFTGPTFETGPSSLVCNDAGLAIMKEPDGDTNRGCFEEIFRVWLTDANEPHSPSPTINSVVGLHEISPYGGSLWAMVAGAHICITELQPHPTPVPRYMPIGGTPVGILHSERLDALVTVVVKSGIPSLHFFDPVTGADLSHPVKKTSDQDDGRHVDVEYITYLGNPDTKIVSMLDWRYKNNGNVYEWYVILARLGDGQGRLLVVSAEQEAAIPASETPRRIRFWTRFIRKIKDGAPRAGTTDDNGLFLNIGKTLEYHVIEDKKFRTAMKYDLPSPATSLEVVDGHLHVLTTHHSLIILDYMSEVALKSQQMVQIHTDEVARNGLHSIDAELSSGTKERHQRLHLVSDPMCSVFGLWSPGRSFGASSLQLMFQAHLAVSIRRFVHGYTRPRWTRHQPRCGHLPGCSDRRNILGLAMDGSLTQFSILHEYVWQLLRYIQNLAMASSEICLISREHDGSDDFELDLNSISKTRRHIDGDILQRCLEKKALDRIVSTPQQLVQLQELLRPLKLGTDTSTLTAIDEALLAYEHTYGLLEFYLSPAL